MSDPDQRLPQLPAGDRWDDLDAAPTHSLEETSELLSAWDGLLPEYIGPYRVVRVLGEGGMSTVFLAEQSEPIQRQVAIKLISRGMVDPRVVRRFEAERQALARLHHPNIAQVFDAGVHAGHPYLVMEHVPGLPIDRYCDQHRFDLRQRLELFMVLCDAVQHTHQKALLHRDLKPDNALVTEEQGRPMLKVIDFGIVKSLAEPLGRDALPTAHLVGTPAFLAPESIRAWGHGAIDADTRADIYALGMVLYQLLVGELPFDSASGLELLRSILDREPPRPSARFAALDAAQQERLAGSRSTDPGTLVRRLRDDLDWIVLKAVARERSDRYASATELGADVARYLRHEPVLAGPPGALYRISKFVYRHRLGVVSAVLIVLALVGGMIGFILQAQRANREAETSREVSRFLVDLFEVSDPGQARGNKVTARELLDRGAEKIRRDLATQPQVQAHLMHTIGTVYRKLGLYDRAETLLLEALALRRQESHGDDLEVARTLFELSVLYSERGRWVEAEQALKSTLELQERLLGTEDAELAATLNSLASLYGRQGKMELIEPLLLRALALGERSLGPDHPDLAGILNNLGSFYGAQGRLADAEQLYRRALNIRQRFLGPDHPRVAFSLEGLGVFCRLQGRYDEAEAFHRQALGIFEHALGPHHPNVAMSLESLAKVYSEQERYAQAEPLFRRALAIHEAVVGGDNLQLRAPLLDLAAVLRATGGEAEAVALERRAAALREAPP